MDVIVNSHSKVADANIVSTFAPESIIGIRANPNQLRMVFGSQRKGFNRKNGVFLAAIKKMYLQFQYFPFQS